jgi:hypothetical protein
MHSYEYKLYRIVCTVWLSKYVYVVAAQPWWLHLNASQWWIVGRVMGFLGLVPSLEWCVSVLLYHISHWVPGLTDRLKPLALLKLLGWSLISIVPFIKQSMYPGALSIVEVLLKLILCPSTLRKSLAGPDISVSRVPYIWPQASSDPVVLQILMTCIEMVLEMSVILNQLNWLIARRFY